MEDRKEHLHRSRPLVPAQRARRLQVRQRSVAHIQAKSFLMQLRQAENCGKWAGPLPQVPSGADEDTVEIVSVRQWKFTIRQWDQQLKGLHAAVVVQGAASEWCQPL